MFALNHASTLQETSSTAPDLCLHSTRPLPPRPYAPGTCPKRVPFLLTCAWQGHGQVPAGQPLIIPVACCCLVPHPPLPLLRSLLQTSRRLIPVSRCLRKRQVAMAVRTPLYSRVLSDFQEIAVY
jgi:hypothetical protein